MTMRAGALASLLVLNVLSPRWQCANELLCLRNKNNFSSDFILLKYFQVTQIILFSPFACVKALRDSNNSRVKEKKKNVEKIIIKTVLHLENSFSNTSMPHHALHFGVLLLWFLLVFVRRRYRPELCAFSVARLV